MKKSVLVSLFLCVAVLAKRGSVRLQFMTAIPEAKQNAGY